MQLPNWLTQRTLLSPAALALITAQERLTFHDLNQRVTMLAGRLAGAGATNGAAIALLARNSADYVVALHAISALGGVSVPLNTRLTAAELAWQIGNVNATMLLHDRDLTADQQANLDAIRELVPAVQMAALPLDGYPTAAIQVADYYDLDAAHSIIHTSGTTGQPKGAVLTYGNHWWSAVGSALNLGLTLGQHDTDRWLAALPLFHVGGLSIALRSVIYGIPMVLHQGFEAAAVNHALVEERVTIISVVAVMLTRMLDEWDSHGVGRPYPSHLRCALLGGGPAPLALLERCAGLGVPVIQTYGLTEAASQVATLAPDQAMAKLGSAGKPLFPTELRIITADPEAGTVNAVPNGTIGELTVRGPTVSPRYHGRPPRDPAAWFHTGDLGYLDDEGYLYVVDRRDDLIISGGENVYPAEVEAILLAYPAILEAGVTGIPDSRWGAVPVAAIRLRLGSSLSLESLAAFCAERLARYKIPSQWVIVEDLPRTASGKVIRKALAALFDSRLH